MPTYKLYANDAEKLKTYRHRIKRANDKFEKREQVAKALFDRYEMKPRGKEYTERGHRITVPAGISTVDSVYAVMTAVEPEVHVQNIAHGTRLQAEIAEAGIREVWRETRVARKSEEALKDALIGGIGFIKVGYEYEEEERERPKTDEEIALDVEAIFQDAESQGAEPPLPDQVADLVDTRTFESEVTLDRIVVDYVPWEDMRWDTSAKRWEDVRWVAQVSRLPEHEVKQNPAYREYARSKRQVRELDKLKPDTSVQVDSEGGGVESRERRHTDDLRITVYELYDFDTGTVCTFAENGEFLLNEAPNPLAINPDREDKNPFVAVVLRKKSTDVVGLSDMKVIEPTLDELELYRGKLATYLSRFVPKVFGPARSLTEAGKKALESQEYGAFVELEEEHTANDIQPMDPPTLPAEVFGIEQRLEDNIREATGVNELMRGLFPVGRQTATETQEVAAGGTARHSEKRNKLEQFYVDIARRVLIFMQMFYEAPRVSRMVGEEADEIWTWSAEDIVMEASLDIKLAPKEAVAPQQKRDNALAVWNMFAPVPEVDRRELLKFTMTEFGVPKEVVRDLLKTDEELQQEREAEAQQQAVEAQAEEGEMPDPAQVPGPMAGDELAAATNMGEVPEEMLSTLGMGPGVGP